MKRKSLCIIILLALLVTSIPSLSFASDSRTLEKKGEFNYSTTLGNTPQYYFSSNYFLTDNTTYNNDLAILSLYLAISAFNSSDGGTEDYSRKYSNVKSFLCSDLEFESFMHNKAYAEKPRTDSIGVAAAKKTLTDNNGNYTLIAVAVRGGGYEREWISNFTLGRTGQAQGFSESKQQVLSFIRQYLSDNAVNGRIKIWITGFSRGAAVANLTAGALDDGFLASSSAVYSFNPENSLFAYTFETPMGANRDEIRQAEAANPSKYNNIWNIINKNDFITKVAPTELGFTRYGNDFCMPDSRTSENYTSQVEAMLKIYSSLTGRDSSYKPDLFKMKQIDRKSPSKQVIDDTNYCIPMSMFVDEFSSALFTTFAVDRENYVAKYQDVFCTLFLSLFDGTYSKYLQNQWSSFMGKLLTGNSDSDTSDDSTSLEETSSGFKNAMNAINKLVRDFNQIYPDLGATFEDSSQDILSTHDPYLCMSWLMSMSSNYTSTPVTFSGTGNYRTVTVTAEDSVRIIVNDSNGKCVASLTGGTPVRISGSSITSAVNRQGENIIVLPVSGKYSIEISANNNTTANMVISEYDQKSKGIVRTLSFTGFDIPADTGCRCDVPAYSSEEIRLGTPDGSETVYSLYSGKSAINPDKTSLTSAAEILLTIGKNYARINGNTVSLDATPIIVSNRTMLPVRIVAEALGADVNWNQTEKSVFISDDSTVIKLITGQNKAYVNGVEKNLDTASFILNNRTYLPLRFIAENLNATVKWNQTDKTVLITKSAFSG